jgi:predicted DNA-binding transcriptional regulator AlpA
MESVIQNPATVSGTPKNSAPVIPGASLLLDAEEVAGVLGLSKRCVYALCRSGELPTASLPSMVHPGQIMRRTRIPRAGLERYIASITNGGAR